MHGPFRSISIMRESLSLFEDPPSEEWVTTPADPPARSRRDRHLAAARRLARRIGRLPDHSEAQVEAGQSICRHLLAMLRESLTPPGEDPATPPRH